MRKYQKKTKEALKKKFPAAREASWSLGPIVDEVEFEDGSITKTALYSKSGVWKETRFGIEDETLPEVVKNAIMKAYPNSYTEGSLQIDSPNGTNYETTVVNEDESAYTVFLSKSGKMISSTEITSDDDEEGDW